MKTQGAAPQLKAPSVWDYTDYRVFLQDYLSHKRLATQGFSVRQFSIKAGISTQNYLLKVIRGERKLGPKLTESFIQAIPLKAASADYFRSLVDLVNAKDEKEQVRLRGRLDQLRRGKRAGTAITDHSLLQHWYYSAIWELGACLGFELTAENVVQTLKPRISHQEAKEALEFLLRKGCLVEKSGRLVQSDTPVITRDEMTDALIRHNHREYLEKAAPAIDLPIEERGFYGLTIAVSAERLPEIKKRIKEFMDGLQAELALDPRADTVYRVNSHVFPLAKTEKSEARAQGELKPTFMIGPTVPSAGSSG